MNLKKYFNYYEATFPGEIQEKIKRKILIKTGLFEKNNTKKISINLEINPIFEKIINNQEKKDFLNKIPKDFYIFNQKINFEKEVLDDNQNSKKWYLENISKYKDIKVTWEINRLQFLNYLVVKNKKEKAIELLDEWIVKNPYDLGINWNSNLEVAIRSISIINFLFKLKDKKLIEKYKNILFLHGNHIYHDIFYTEKCIPNNHVIGEAAALYCLGNILDFDGKNKWLSKAKQILEKYIYHFHDDGTYEEASLSYHRFTLQMYIMVFIFSTISHDEFLKEKIVKILKNSLIFFNSIEKPNEEYPDFGDNDEGLYFLVLNKRNFLDFVKSLRKVFNQDLNYHGEIQELEDIYHIKLDCLKFEENEEREFFEIGKYYSYKTDTNYIFIHNQKQIYHSHSDGMAVELVLENKNVLIDSGTFNYNIDNQKRRFYRGTKSHNTVWLGEDQSLQIGSFRWINRLKQNMNFQKIQNKRIISSEVILKNKKHQRNINFDEDFMKIEVEDKVFNADNFELNWIFSNEILLEKINENIFRLNPINYTIEILSKNSLKIELCNNFYSLKYNEEIQGQKIKISSKEKINNIEIITKFKRDSL